MCPIAYYGYAELLLPGFDDLRHVVVILSTHHPAIGTDRDSDRPPLIGTQSESWYRSLVERQKLTCELARERRGGRDDQNRHGHQSDHHRRCSLRSHDCCPLRLAGERVAGEDV